VGGAVMVAIIFIVLAIYLFKRPNPVHAQGNIYFREPNRDAFIQILDMNQQMQQLIEEDSFNNDWPPPPEQNGPVQNEPEIQPEIQPENDAPRQPQNAGPNVNPNDDWANDGLNEIGEMLAQQEREIRMQRVNRDLNRGEFRTFLGLRKTKNVNYKL